MYEDRIARAKRDARVPECGPGLLEYDDFSSACLIQDVSTHGFLLECLDEFVIGQRMQLTSRLGVHCTLEVRHVDGSRVGAKIVEIDAESARLCRELIEQYYALQLKRRQLS